MSDRKKAYTIRDRLKILREIYPRKRKLRLLQKNAPNTAKRATLWMLIESDEGTHALHSSLFNKKRAMTALEWDHFMHAKVLRGTGHPSEGTPAERMGILTGAIIPGIQRRTPGKFWNVQVVIGYALHHANHTPLSRFGYKAESPGKPRG